MQQLKPTYVLLKNSGNLSHFQSSTHLKDDLVSLTRRDKNKAALYT